jgi:hypothetical protein
MKCLGGDVCVKYNDFLTPPRQGTTPQILKLKFPVYTTGPKQKRK